MPVSFAIVDQQLEFTTIGDVEYESGFRTLHEGLKEYQGCACPRNRILFDISLSTESRSSNEIRAIARQIAVYFSDVKIAVLVSSLMYYGLGRMFTAYAETKQIEVMVFKEEHAARQWLDG